MTGDRADTGRRTEVSVQHLHRDSVADTGCTFIAFRGWVLTCLWCEFTARGGTKTEALNGMQRHYDEFGIQVYAQDGAR